LGYGKHLKKMVTISHAQGGDCLRYEEKLVLPIKEGNSREKKGGRLVENGERGGEKGCACYAQGTYENSVWGGGGGGGGGGEKCDYPGAIKGKGSRGASLGRRKDFKCS